MNTVFIGGSRHVSRLPDQVKDRLNNIIESGHQVILGDANGADKAVQKYFQEASYDKVTVFCSGDTPRNNLGKWHIQSVFPPESSKGFQFFAAKDREMAREADFGFMIWDGKSPGTVLNVLRLVRAGKKAVLINVPEKSGTTFKSAMEWADFLAHCNPELKADLRERALPEEWGDPAEPSQPGLFDGQKKVSGNAKPANNPQLSEGELIEILNVALAAGDQSTFVDALGNIAKFRGMTNVAKESGLSRESLYRSLGTGGNPEFASVLKVLSAMDLRLEIKKSP